MADRIELITAAVAAVAAAVFWLARRHLVAPVWRAWGVRRRIAWLIGIAVCAGVFAAAPGRLPEWQVSAGEATWRSADEGPVTEWGMATTAIWMHAQAGGIENWRSALDLPPLARRLGGRVVLQAAQPRKTVFDEQGVVRSANDGLRLEVLIERQGEFELLRGATLHAAGRAAQRGWNTLRVALPAGAERLHLRALPQNSPDHDTLLMHLAALDPWAPLPLWLAEWAAWGAVLLVIVCAALGPPEAAAEGGGFEPQRGAAIAGDETPEGVGKRPLFGTATPVLTFALLATICIATYVNRESSAVFFWDFAGYWSASIELKDRLEEAPGQALRALRQSLGTDYSDLPAMLPGAMMAVLGKSRMSYILGLAYAYAIPTLLALGLVCRDLSGARRGGAAASLSSAAGAGAFHAPAIMASAPAFARWVPVLVLLVLPFFWQPMVRGYADAGGAAMALVVLWLYFRGVAREAERAGRPPHPNADIAQETRAGRTAHRLEDIGQETRAGRPHSRGGGALLVVGVLLAAMPLYRRWYTFWVAAFLVMILVDAGLRWVAAMRASGRAAKGGAAAYSAWRTMAALGRAPVVIAATTACVLVGLATPFIEHALTGQFAWKYSAYRAADLPHALLKTIHYYGYYHVALVAAGLVLLGAARSTRRIGLFLVAHACIVLLLFHRVQAMSSHHHYLLQPLMLTVLGVGLVLLLRGISAPPARLGLMTLYAAGGVMLMFATFSPRAAGLREALGAWAPGQHVYPLQRGDRPELARLLADVDAQLAGTAGELYVISSSGVFCEEVLKNAILNPPGLRFKSARRVLPAHHVDLRDGFPQSLLRATLVAVASPVQTHLDPAHQRVVTIPARSFLEGRDIAHAFERLPGIYRLDGGVEVRVFRKVRPIAPDELRALDEAFRSLYPHVSKLHAAVRQ